MEFRRSGQRDERRRRVLMDEMRAPSQETEAVGAGGERTDRSAAYAAAARDEQQPALTTLIPKRPWTVAVLLLVGLVGIAGIETLYSAVWKNLTPAEAIGLGSLDVQSRGSLAQWFSSGLLLLAAAYSIMVLHLRRHRIDDYRGRYRVWRWCLAGLLLASIDVTTQLHTALSAALISLSGTTLLGDGTVWWCLTAGSLFSLLGIRMLFEVRRSRGATLCLLTAALGYGVALACLLNGLPLDGDVLAAMVSSTSLLVGHFMVAAAVILYCRYVYLEAHGRITVRKKASTVSADASSAPTEAAAESAAPARKKRTRKAKSPAASSTDPSADDSGSKLPKVKGQPTLRVDEAHDTRRSSTDEDDASGAPRKLSKAERRRLRKLRSKQ